MTPPQKALSFYSDQDILDEVRRRNLDKWDTSEAWIKSFAESLVGLHESEAKERVMDAGFGDVSLDTDSDSWVVGVRIYTPVVMGGEA